VRCFVPWWREKKLDVFFFPSKAVDVHWEVVLGFVMKQAGTQLENKKVRAMARPQIQLWQKKKG
jgi:hypothetical protein